MSNDTKMSEAEVSLNLALFLIRNKLVVSDVFVALDGAQIKTENTTYFHIEDFMKKNNCDFIDVQKEWRGTYRISGFEKKLIVHTTAGKGDVVARLIDGSNLRVESKKGDLKQTKGSKEYPLLREAIGQLMTFEEYTENDKLAVAVPYSSKFEELTSRWKDAPLIKKLKIRFLLVRKDGRVEGFDDI